MCNHSELPGGSGSGDSWGSQLGVSAITPHSSDSHPLEYPRCMVFGPSKRWDPAMAVLFTQRRFR